MRKLRGLLVIGLFAMGLLAACSGGAAETAVSNSSGSPRLTADYNQALPVQSQLAVGTLQLEETDLAVDEALAAEILPLWRALQSFASLPTPLRVRR